MPTDPLHPRRPKPNPVVIVTNTIDQHRPAFFPKKLKKAQEILAGIKPPFDQV